MRHLKCNVSTKKFILSRPLSVEAIYEQCIVNEMKKGSCLLQMHFKTMYTKQIPINYNVISLSRQLEYFRLWQQVGEWSNYEDNNYKQRMEIYIALRVNTVHFVSLPPFPLLSCLRGGP